MQRVAVARALAHQPRLLLADEPTGNLDEANAGRIMDLFGAIHQQRLTTLVVVTHSPEMAAQAGRVVRLRNGRIDADSARKGHGGRAPRIDDRATVIGHPAHG
jgi:putative ABC transport system ATP-binding protein